MGRLSRRFPASLAPAALIAFCTIWRIPGLADPPWLNDEGVYASVGRALLHGERLYRQIWENKPPAIYLVNAAAEQVGGAVHVITTMRLLALVASVVALTAIYRLMSARRGPTLALLAVVLAGIGLDLPLIDGTEANAEIFVAAASAVGMALVWHALDVRLHSPGHSLAANSSLLLAGIAFGVSILFKLPAGADALAAALVVLFYDSPPADTAVNGLPPDDAKHLGVAVARLGLLSVGAAIPLSAIAVWLAVQGLLDDALYATIGYNRGYVSTGQSLHSPLVSVLTVAAPIAALGVGTVIARRRRGGVLPFGAGASWWLGLSLLGALASGRTYPHYFLQAVAPVAICLTLLIERLVTRASRRAETDPYRWEDRRAASRHAALIFQRIVVALVIVWAAAVPLASTIALARTSPNPSPGSDTVAYYAYFWQYATGDLSDTAYGNRIDPRVERNVAVAAYLKAHPRAPERLYVWGNAPWIYYLSGYEHAARFLSAFYRPVVPGSGASVLPVLQGNPPPYIVLIEPATPPALGLAPFLRAHYRAVFRVGNAVVYGKITR